jgi:hypothetical protein
MRAKWVGFVIWYFMLHEKSIRPNSSSLNMGPGMHYNKYVTLYRVFLVRQLKLLSIGGFRMIEEDQKHRTFYNFGELDNFVYKYGCFEERNDLVST